MTDLLPKDILINLPAFETLDPSLVKIIFVALFVFFFLILLAFARQHIIHTSLRGLRAGLITGVIGVLLVEAAIFVAVKHYILGEKNSTLPRNIRIVLEESQAGLTQVMGINTERKQKTAQEVLTDYKILSPIDAELVKNSVCKQKDEH